VRTPTLRCSPTLPCPSSPFGTMLGRTLMANITAHTLYQGVRGPPSGAIALVCLMEGLHRSSIGSNSSPTPRSRNLRVYPASKKCMETESLGLPRCGRAFSPEIQPRNSLRRRLELPFYFGWPQSLCFKCGHGCCFGT